MKAFPHSWSRLVLVLLFGSSAWVLPAQAEQHSVTLELQRRDPASGQPIVTRTELDPAKVVMVVVDMWDRHWCKTYTARVENMVARMNQTAAAARKLGIQVVWAPSDVVGFYKNHPQRQAMLAIPTHPEPKTVAFDPPTPPEGLDCCECGPDRPCKNASVWTRQHSGLQIADGDLIGDCNNARELYNLCAERGLDTILYLGVASNMCVCHRSFGILNSKHHGFRALFVRDLVEAITANGLHPATKQSDWNFTPAKGSARTERYLEQHIAPSIESRQLIAAAGTSPFAGDRRPHLAFVIADDEYKSEQTLLAFARESLQKDFRCTFCFATGNDPTNRNDVPGMQALYDADLLVFSMRRRALPVTQMDFLERYLRSGKPVVALRVCTVPFQVDPKQRPDGHVIWRDFDQEVLGCHYAGYNPEARKTGTEVWTSADARNHPVLRGIEDVRFHSSMWIYRVNPLAPSTEVLLRGRWSDKDPEEPVAWTNSKEGSRVFYTCLGHPDDFAIPAFRRLLLNAIQWAVKTPSAPR